MSGLFAMISEEFEMLFNQLRYFAKFLVFMWTKCQILNIFYKKVDEKWKYTKLKL